MFCICAKRPIASRYSRTVAVTTERRIAPLKPRSRPATARLAASRFTSHSKGPGNVSSKSLMLKTSLRSGAAKIPKLERCASPQSCACNPVRGPSARSAAIRYAPPRKKENGDTSMRQYRIGPSSGSRVCACCSRRSIGSLRLGAGSQAACAERGNSARAAFPRAARSAGVKYATAFGCEGLSTAGPRSSRMCVAGSSEAAAESDSNGSATPCSPSLAPFHARATTRPSERITASHAASCAGKTRVRDWFQTKAQRLPSPGRVHSNFAAARLPDQGTAGAVATSYGSSASSVARVIATAAASASARPA